MCTKSYFNRNLHHYLSAVGWVDLHHEYYIILPIHISWEVSNNMRNFCNKELVMRKLRIKKYNKGRHLAQLWRHLYPILKCLVQVPALFLTWLPADTLFWKQEVMVQVRGPFWSWWPKLNSCCWPQPGPVWAIGSIWGMNQWLEGLCPFLTLCLCRFLSLCHSIKKKMKVGE